MPGQSTQSTQSTKITPIQTMRDIIMKAAPKAEEVTSYGMPAVKINSIIVWYNEFKSHIGLYPRPSAILYFAKELSKYKTSKGAIQFPSDQPLPAALITKIVKFRIREDAAEATAKAAAKAAKATRKPAEATAKAAKKKSPAKKSAAKKS